MPMGHYPTPSNTSRCLSLSQFGGWIKKDPSVWSLCILTHASVKFSGYPWTKKTEAGFLPFASLMEASIHRLVSTIHPFSTSPIPAKPRKPGIAWRETSALLSTGSIHHDRLGTEGSVSFQQDWERWFQLTGSKYDLVRSNISSKS